MSTFTLTIKTENAAFDEDIAAETARILRKAAEKIEAGYDAFKLLDTNGNSVGKAAFKKGKP